MRKHHLIIAGLKLLATDNIERLHDLESRGLDPHQVLKDSPFVYSLEELQEMALARYFDGRD